MASSHNFTLPQIAERIKIAEKKRLISGVIEIGGWLHMAAEKCEHGEYMEWLKTNFGWSHSTSVNYREVYLLSQNHKISNCDISVSALYLVAKCINAGGPDVAKGEAILEAAKQGRVSFQIAVDILARLKLAELPDDGEADSDDADEDAEDDDVEDDVKDDEGDADDSGDDDDADDADDEDDDGDPPKMMPMVGRCLHDLHHYLVSDPDVRSETEEHWPTIIDRLGTQKFLEIITTLQTVYDKYVEHRESSAVKRAADRAEKRKQ